MADNTSQICNICQGTTFKPFANRENAQCAKCRSLEHSRGMFHLLQNTGVLRPGAKVIHFAPEFGIGLKIRDIVGAENYQAFDLFPEIYPKELSVRRFDLCEPEKLPSNTYDLIFHSHVLEHIPGYVATVLWHMQRALSPEGVHLFCIPVMQGRHESDFNDIGDDLRLKRFGQIDHCRRFGIDDLERTIGSVVRLGEDTYGFDLPQDFCDRHNIVREEVRRTVFMMRKSDLLLSDNVATTAAPELQGLKEALELAVFKQEETENHVADLSRQLAYEVRRRREADHQRDVAKAAVENIQRSISYRAMAPLRQIRSAQIRLTGRRGGKPS